MYVISAFVVVGAVIASVYGYHPFQRNEEETSATLIGTNVKDTTNSAVLMPVEAKPELKIDLIKYTPQAASGSNPDVDDLITEAIALISAKPGRIIDARDRLNEAMLMPMNEQQQAFVKKQLSELADKWLFSGAVFEQDKLCGSYKVKLGDKLNTIGRRFKVPYKILMKINNITRPKALRAGETIKVINGPFHARIDRSAFTMDLYLQDTFVRSFPVVLGRSGMETPTGYWVVRTYEAEDPDYPLGSRWIGLEGIEGSAKGRTGFAIHGTTAQEDLGTARSRGCIRLYDEDAILVYDLLVPGLSHLVIVE
jgi:hypothetical protein